MSLDGIQSDSLDTRQKHLFAKWAAVYLEQYGCQKNENLPGGLEFERLGSLSIDAATQLKDANNVPFVVSQAMRVFLGEITAEDFFDTFPQFKPWFDHMNF